MTTVDESTPLVPPFTRVDNYTVSSFASPAEILHVHHHQQQQQRVTLFQFLEGTSASGAQYEKFTIFLIFLSVVTSILSTVFLPEFNTTSEWADKCDSWCDAIWFGNRGDNVLSQFLDIGSTSVVEIFVVGAFTVDYILRVYTADMIDPVKYGGVLGRLRFMTTFFALVDFFSIAPFYVDAFLLPNTELGASTFLRMFRLLRMMKVEGRFDLALGLIDDVFYAQKDVLGTALFVGITVWAVLSSFFYLAERRNPSMIYCGAAPNYCQDVDTSLCTIDEWGIVDCSAAGCASWIGDNGTVVEEVCWNVYRSIVDSSFWTLMNLFGEYPLFDGHSVSGKILGTFTAAFAVAVFALPVGVLASGFEDQIARRREERRKNETRQDDADTIEANEEIVTENRSASILGDAKTLKGWAYNFFHRQDSASAIYFSAFVRALISGCAIAFVVDSVVDADGNLHIYIWWFQLVSGLVFAAEYCLSMYSAGVNPMYGDFDGLIRYAVSPLRIIDALSIVPFFVGLMFTSGNAPSLFLLLKILRFSMCYDAIATFGYILQDNIDVLSVTLFSSALLWILFSSVLYFTERNNPDDDIKKYYSTIPNSMWITLLNLSGECPLAYYSSLGKVIVGFIGLFATAVFGVPIGVLGAGFEELVTRKYDESPNEEATTDVEEPSRISSVQVSIYQFVNGIGSTAGMVFELSIYLLIGVTVTLGIVQTVPGYENFGHQVEWLAVIIFTVEYILRLIGAAADPEFASCSNGFLARVKYIFSFYSVIDLLAIVPFYYAYLNPDSWINAHDEYLRMMRLMRLLKLDKYIPSISLLDDVFRLKRRILVVAGYAALTLWFLFSAAMYTAERNDVSMEIDPIPLYGCVENCTMSNRYKDYFTSFPLTGIHLTGDFPLIEYGGLGRVILFFIVITAVGIVAVPSGVIASGFAEIVERKHTVASKDSTLNKGDDWYDIKYRQLSGHPPPPSTFGPAVDLLQLNVKEYLDGRVNEKTGEVTRTQLSKFGRVFFATLIITNIVAIILESVPEIDKRVGNSAGNFFDEFEKWSVFFFTADYILRLFSAGKSRKALYSPWVYATTFFGIVDLVSILPWYIQAVLALRGKLSADDAKVFRIVRIFRVLQLEDFLVAFSKLDNVFRASKDVLKATGLLAIIIWVGTSALFFIFEQNNPNFRQCDDSIPIFGTEEEPGCADFESTLACNEFYPNMCSQTGFDNMPNVMYYVAVFLVGEWGVVDFTWMGKLVCMFLCVAGIALYSIPVGSLFDSFGAVIGLSEDEENDQEEEAENRK